MKTQPALSLTIVLLFFSIQTSFAGYSMDWFRTSGNVLKSASMVTRDASNNVFITGYNYDIFTRKYDKYGNFLWEAVSASGVNNIYERSTWITTDASGNIIVMGMRYQQFSGAQLPVGVIIIKYNQSGTQLWKTVVTGTFGSTSNSFTNFD